MKEYERMWEWMWVFFTQMISFYRIRFALCLVEAMSPTHMWSITFGNLSLLITFDCIRDCVFAADTFASYNANFACIVADKLFFVCIKWDKSLVPKINKNEILLLCIN
jgi:hypothetical protein